jgi:hypothetical protein
VAKTAGKPARPTADRVQGIDSVVQDLVLHATGRSVEVELGATLVPTPKLTRTINGASSIELEIEDISRRVLRHLLVSSKWDAELDGMRFRYPGGLSKTGDTLNLTLEDRWVALLREKKGPKHVVRGSGAHQMTRAEFIKMLVEEACPGLDFYCPQLHVQQPIKTKRQGKKAKEEAKENRRKGIGDVKGLTVEGQAATKQQIEIAERALRVAESHGADTTVQEAVMVALMDESHIGALTGGSNVLQAEGSGEGAEKGSVETEVTNFLTGSGGYGEGGALGIEAKHPGYTPPEIATTAQRNLAFLQGGLQAGAAPYARFSSEARKWVEAMSGGELTEAIDFTEPYEFKVGKKENYWTAIKRLAKEVNWRAFIVVDRFFYVPEPELLQGAVRLAIDGDTPGIENIDFEYDGNHPVTEATVEVLVSQWKPPPGSVATVADYGPLSIGFPNPPVKKDAKGDKAGVSSGRNTRTREGGARLIVSSIEVPLSNDPAQRLAVIKLHRPTPPLPEPAAETKSIGGASASAAGNKTVERMLAAAEREAEKKLPYIWGGFDPNKGFDCSGGVSWELNIGGFMTGRTDTQGLAAWGEAGPGELITVYIKTTGDAEEEHTAIEIAGIVFESGGGGENSNPNGGWGKVNSSEVTDFLKQFDTKRHPKGF